MNRRLSSVLLIVLALYVSVGHARTWTDSTGQFTVEAEFVGLEDGNVRLKKTDGAIIVVPLEKLSDEDRQCLKADLYLEHVLRKGNIGEVMVGSASVQDLMAMAADVVVQKDTWSTFKENPETVVQFLLSDLRRRGTLPDHVDIELRDADETRAAVEARLGRLKGAEEGAFPVMGMGPPVRVKWFDIGYLRIGVTDKGKGRVQGIRVLCEPFLKSHE